MLVNKNNFVQAVWQIARNPYGSRPKLDNHWTWSIVFRSVSTVTSAAEQGPKSGLEAEGQVMLTEMEATSRHHQPSEGAKTSASPPKCHNIWRTAFTPTVASSFSCHTAALWRKNNKKNKNTAKHRIWTVIAGAEFEYLFLQQWQACLVVSEGLLNNWSHAASPSVQSIAFCNKQKTVKPALR